MELVKHLAQQNEDLARQVQSFSLEQQTVKQDRGSTHPVDQQKHAEAKLEPDNELTKDPQSGSLKRPPTLSLRGHQEMPWFVRASMEGSCIPVTTQLVSCLSRY